MVEVVIKLIFLIFILMIEVEPKKAATFLVSFQSDRNRSIEHWMRYNENFEGYQKEFTACHWQRVRYFSNELNCVWAYCYIGRKKDRWYHVFNFISELITHPPVGPWISF